jgi:iron-sulfur cluster repair protein YtfE (RIC family)
MNPMLKPLCPTATAMIRKDHAAVLAKFHAYSPEAEASRRDAIARGICTALEVHAQVEEELFYPALRSAGIGGETLDKSQPEHDEMRRAIERVRGAAGQAEAQSEALCALMNLVMHHVADEETMLLPLAEQRLGAARLAELGQRMTERKLQLAKPHLGELATDIVRAQPGRSAALGAGALLAGVLVWRGLRRRAY